MTDILSSKYIYEGHIINLRLDKINLGPSKKENRLREVVEHNAAVAILPIVIIKTFCSSGNIDIQQKNIYLRSPLE